MDKKTEQIAIHLSTDKKAQVAVLAELENKSLSEMGELIIDQYIERKKRQFQLMQKAFLGIEDGQNDKNYKKS